MSFSEDNNLLIYKLFKPIFEVFQLSPLSSEIDIPYSEPANKRFPFLEKDNILFEGSASVQYIHVFPSSAELNGPRGVVTNIKFLVAKNF